MSNIQSCIINALLFMILAQLQAEKSWMWKSTLEAVAICWWVAVLILVFRGLQ